MEAVYSFNDPTGHGSAATRAALVRECVLFDLGLHNFHYDSVGKSGRNPQDNALYLNGPTVL